MGQTIKFLIYLAIIGLSAAVYAYVEAVLGGGLCPPSG